MTMLVVLLDLFRGTMTQRNSTETQQLGQGTKDKNERRAENDMLKRPRSWTVKKYYYRLCPQGRKRYKKKFPPFCYAQAKE